jgi:hypothetical protein
MVVTVFLRGIFARWLAGLIIKGFQGAFIRTERELALYMHYRDKASGRSKKL